MQNVLMKGASRTRTESLVAELASLLGDRAQVRLARPSETLDRSAPHEPTAHAGWAESHTLPRDELRAEVLRAVEATERARVDPTRIAQDIIVIERID